MYVVAGCVLLGGFVPFMLQPVLGWPNAARWAGWGSVLVLLAAISVNA